MAKFIRIAVFPLLLLLFLTVGASAEYITNKAEFMQKYPDLKLQDFSGSLVPGGDGATCTGPLTYLSNNACIPQGQIDPALDFNTLSKAANNLWMLGINSDGASNPNNSLVSNFTRTPVIVNFHEPVNVIALDVGCLSKLDFPNCKGRAEVEVFGFNDTMLGGFELEISDQFDSFLGVVIGEPIRQIRINPIDPNGDIGMFVGTDAVYFAFVRNVPTMSEWGLIATVAGLGIIGFIVINRRRKAYN